jgi:hypothetical protein
MNPTTRNTWLVLGLWKINRGFQVKISAVKTVLTFARKQAELYST